MIGTGIAALTIWLAQASAQTPIKSGDLARQLKEGNEKILSEPLKNFYFNIKTRIPKLKGAYGHFTKHSPTAISRRIDMAFELSEALIADSKPEEAIELLSALKKEALSGGAGPVSPEDLSLLWNELAIAYFRLGEVQNCVLHHNSSSCIFPIKGAGRHGNKKGAQGAARELTELLERQPDNLQAIWLLNLSHMALGTYPSGVPKKFLIPPSALNQSEQALRFKETSAQVGMPVASLAGGVIADDFDGDGATDIMLCSAGVDHQLRYFHNDGKGRFTEQTTQAGLKGITGGINLVQTDYNNDGCLDAFLMRGGFLGGAGFLPNTLLKNDCHGRFTDVTEQAGLWGAFPTHVATWGDYDNDGFLDVFIGNESTHGNKVPTQLFHNNGNGTFTDVAAQAGVLLSQFVKGVVWGDYDNDGRLDLFVSTFSVGSRLYHNDGPDSKGRWKFSEVSEKSGIKGPKRGFTSMFFDYDNDGWLDIFAAGYPADSLTRADVGNYAAELLGKKIEFDASRMYRNNGDGTFTDMTQSLGLNKYMLAIGVNFGDIDNDGWSDLYIGSGHPAFQAIMPNRLYRNKEGSRFHEITVQSGTGNLQKTHGIAFASFRNNGHQDIYASIGGMYPSDSARHSLFQNPGMGTGNAWLAIKLVGSKSNRVGIGARIKVTVRPLKGKTREIHSVVSSGGSYGASPLRKEIGLGKIKAVESLEIAWPSGLKQVLKGVKANRFIEIREGVERVKYLKPKKQS